MRDFPSRSSLSKRMVPGSTPNRYGYLRYAERAEVLVSNGKIKYDVAISFLVQDAAIAQALYEKLSGGLRVFFFPRNQEELAGTDGLETMRVAFRHESLLNVVLYRERWGNTPWTAVEAAAVKDSCLATAFRSLFFFVVESTSVLPVWLPDTHVRFNYADFPLDEAVGAIKARVRELGGHIEPLTPLKQAERLRAAEEYRREKSMMGWDQGLARIREAARALFNAVEKHCIQISEQGSVNIRCEWSWNEGNATTQECVFTTDGGGFIIYFLQPYINSLEKCGLLIQEYERKLNFRSDPGMQYWVPREPIAQHRYAPELSRAREYGWHVERNEGFVSSESLAEKCVISLLAGIDMRAEKHSRERS